VGACSACVIHLSQSRSRDAYCGQKSKGEACDEKLTGGKSPNKKNDTTDHVEREILAVEPNVKSLLAEVPQNFELWEEDREKGTLSYISPMAPPVPIDDPRDTHRDKFMSKDTKQWLNFLQKEKESMKQNKFIFVQGSDMRSLLTHVFGAKEGDFAELENICDNQNHDPKLKFRKIASWRLSMDLAKGIAWRVERTPWVLTKADGFVRGGEGGTYRFFGEAQDWIMQNTAWQALIRFKAFMMCDVPVNIRPGCDPERNISLIGNQMRIMATPTMAGEPASEGVHQDGCEFTMTTLFKSRNVDWASGSAMSTALSMNHKIGVKIDEIDEDCVVARVQHKNFLDTLLFVDNELQHYVTPIQPLDKEKVAHRDIIAFHARHMAYPEGSYSAAPFDTEEPHPELPFAMSLRSKYATKYYPEFDRLRSVPITKREQEDGGMRSTPKMACGGG